VARTSLRSLGALSVAEDRHAPVVATAGSDGQPKAQEMQRRLSRPQGAMGNQRRKKCSIVAGRLLSIKLFWQQSTLSR